METRDAYQNKSLDYIVLLLLKGRKACVIQLFIHQTAEQSMLETETLGTVSWFFFFLHVNLKPRTPWQGNSFQL